MSRVSEKPRLSEQVADKPKVLWFIALCLPVVISASVLVVAKMEQLKNISTPAPTASPVPTSINALGRLEPLGEVVRLSAPTGIQGTSRVEQMFVREGENVKKGQVIAILDGFASKQAALEEARAKLQEARANLVNVNVVSPREIEAQKAVIARLQAQLRGETDAAVANINSLEAQLRGEQIAQRATVNRLQAQLKGQTNALKATVARLQAEQRNALLDARRYESLYREGAISQQERDRRRLSAVTTTEQVAETQAVRAQTITSLQQQLAEAKANLEKTTTTLRQQLVEALVNRDKTIAVLQKQIDQEIARLNRLQEVRPSDLQIAQAQVNNAIAVVKRAEADLQLSYITTPISGEILKINTKAGETMSVDGIAEIGRTDQMIVIAEVPEDSISKVRLKQQAIITSDNGAFAGELQGTVTEIGRKIGKKDVLNTDPSADVDARVVEVKITLTPEDSQKVSGLTYAKVLVEITRAVPNET
jgi:HlyD family secretion protein